MFFQEYLKRKAINLYKLLAKKGKKIFQLRSLLTAAWVKDYSFL